ncbi:DNA polymerase II [Treponema sp. OttesenSCG-928-L16]|nr:DNA polymerase II [Treponema sp. OttesenSCG-928-L16]
MNTERQFRAFLVHTYPDIKKDRLYCTGRLEDGRSFAAVDSLWRPGFHIFEHDTSLFRRLFPRLEYGISPSSLESFDGRAALSKVSLAHYGDRAGVLEQMEAGGISSPDAQVKPADAFLMERRIKGPVEIHGECRPGKQLDLVFFNPSLAPLHEPARIPLRIASVDIETDTRRGSIRAVSVSLAASDFSSPRGWVRLLAPGGLGDRAAEENSCSVIYHDDEASLLRAFAEDIRSSDPDLITGWNFLDFDFPRLAERCGALHIPFQLGRSSEDAKFFAAEGRRSAAALIPGRQVLDALRIVRSGPDKYPDHSLETVAQAVLGTGKTIASSGPDKIKELDSLYESDPEKFALYCYNDAELVLRILKKTGLFQLTVERASLTGVSLDKAWTSVVSFERIYGTELLRRNIAPPLARPSGEWGDPAAGGTILDPRPGLFSNIAVFDFRSLYPTIMRTFNIDPLAHARAGFGEGNGSAENISAPNGARFSRNAGILPQLIASYFASRREALDRGDDIAAHVYKILMNSFYGVLGTSACRYGRTELAGAITSYARKWLFLCRDWFSDQGYPVLYGDTDSLFVETGLDDAAAAADFRTLCSKLAEEVNRFLGERIRTEYGLESFLELRFEKAYRRFIIPPLRAFREGSMKGRAKGYGGYEILEDGSFAIEVKGMEAVRSDTTALARRLQLELLELVFSGGGEKEFNERISAEVRLLRAGSLDTELVYRKRLRRPPEMYTASTPPQVKAARALGWKGRRGTVEYVWTTEGAEPASLQEHSLDYDHYVETQIFPLAGSIAAAAGWNTEHFFARGKDRQALEDGQMELGF